jgi:hypothetical protein
MSRQLRLSDDDVVKRALRRSFKGTTPAQYMSVVHSFEKTLKKRVLSSATKSEVAAYVRDSRASVFTRRRRLSALRTACRALLRAGRMTSDPTAGIVVPRPRGVPSASSRRRDLERIGYTRAWLAALTWERVLRETIECSDERRAVWLALLRSAFPGSDPFPALIGRASHLVFEKR